MARKKKAPLPKAAEVTEVVRQINGDEAAKVAPEEVQTPEIVNLADAVNSVIYHAGLPNASINLQKAAKRLKKLRG